MKTRSSSLFPILLTYFLGNFGVAIIFPIYTPLFLNPHSTLLPPGMPLLERTILLGLLLSSFPLAQFFGAPLIGALSDRIGRKKSFCVTIAGTGLGYLMTALSIPTGILPLLYASRLWTGFFAGNLTICLSALADISPDEASRTRHFGLIATMGGISFIVAVLSGSTLSNPDISSLFSPALPFLLTSFLSAINLFFIWRLFHETHPQSPTHKLRLLQGWHHVVAGLRHQHHRSAYLVYFLFSLTWTTSMQFFPTSLFESFAFTPTTVSFALMAVGAFWSLSSWTLNRTLARRYHVINILACALASLSFFLFLASASRSAAIFLPFFLLAAMSGALCWTNCTAFISLSASKERQGTSLGINQSMSALAFVIGPSIGGLVEGLRGHEIYVLTGCTSFLAFAILFIKEKLLPKAS
jgi:DHA1 family tetracycline resistance protein-like MFS transporter